jgi:hypothetical protein
MKRITEYSLWERFGLGCFVCFVVLAIVGAIAFPYAPIHPAGVIYVDKLGHPHTAEYYWRFRLWERSFMVVGSVVALQAVGSAIHRYSRTGSFRIRPPRPNASLQATTGRSDA